MLGRELTFIAEDPPRRSWFAAWDRANPGGLGDQTDETVTLVLPAKRGTRRTEVAAQRMDMREAIDLLAPLGIDDPASPTAHCWAAVTRAALSFIAAGKVLPWVSPDGWDTWRVDPLDAADHEMVTGLVDALVPAAHCTPGPDRATMSDPTFAIRAVCDAIADAFIRTPAAHRVGTLALFADPAPTRVKHLRPWVSDVAGEYCSSSRLVLRMSPPAAPEPEPVDLAVVADLDESHERAGVSELRDSGDRGADDNSDAWQVTFALQSRVDPSLIIEAARFWHAPTEVMERLGSHAEAVLLAGLRTVTQLVEPLADLLDDVAPSHAAIPADQLDSLLDALDDLDRAGIEVRWPSALIAPRIESRLVVSTAAPTGDLATGFSLDAVLEVDWEFLLDGTKMTVQELAVLADAKRAVVPLRGRWVRLDQATRDRLRRPEPKISVANALGAALGNKGELDPAALGLVDGDHDEPGSDPDEHVSIRIVGELDDLIARLHQVTGERQADEPAALDATLRDYQKRGLAWLSDITHLGFGACLADDMGLGKTIQILALHAERQGPTLVVCPTSLMNNWAREAARFVPHARVHIHHGPNRDIPADIGAGDLVVTTYGVVRSDVEDLDKVTWDLVVADEAQHAKNPRSRTARAIRQIGSGLRIALTGTPVENNLSELWSIMDWAVPGLLGPLDYFRRTLALPIERDRNPQATATLQSLIEPFLLRRTKSDPGIAPELPDKIERDVIVPLTDEQVTLYRATTETALTDVAEAEGINRRGLILKLLTALKQITNHPAQYLDQTGPLDGRSGKLAALDELLDRTQVAGESTLVFTQYVAMGRLLVDHQSRAGRRIELLHGGQSVKARQDLVDRFQAGELDVLVLSLKAGGTGLNLTRATSVIHYDRWWNPAVEDQATDRAYRIGQTRTVTVHRIVTEGTIEDRVNDLLSAKRQLADAITSAGESWIGDLDDGDLADLVSLDKL